MTIQIRGLAIALAMAVPIAVAPAAKSSAAPINGTSIKAAAPVMMTDVRYRVRRDRATRGVQRQLNDYPYPTYWGYPNYNSYYADYDRGYYRSACAPGPRIGAFATAPWTDAPTCPPY
jgi:hypothetical protein